MCWFCGCHTKITRQYDPIATYLNCLWKEIHLVSQHLSSRMTVSHIHFGGGTPTILKVEDFVKTLTLIRQKFDLTDKAEIAVEIDPRTTDEGYIRTITEAGVNRASIGVQDFDPKVQKAINRIQPFEITKNVFDWLQKYGVEDINIDLIYGLPYQTVSTITKTIKLAIELNPKRIALFGYAHVPWMKKHQELIKETDLPNIQDRWAHYDMASSLLLSHGYHHIGLDHYAQSDDPMTIALQEGRLHRNFQGYTTDNASTLIGFGASAIGSLPQGYVANQTDINLYKKLISQNNFATKRGIALTHDDRIRRQIIERLMCDLSLDLDQLSRKIGFDPAQFDIILDQLTPMITDGLVYREGRKIIISQLGRPLVRAVCALFDCYLQSGEKKHSRAI